MKLNMFRKDSGCANFRWFVSTTPHRVEHR